MASIRFRSTLVLVFCFAMVSGARAAESTPPRKTKASFLSERELAFIRPGLVFEIQQASVDPDGTVKYQFSVTDPKGAPLDLDGVVTPGTVNVSSILAFIPAGQELYQSYTVRTQTSPITGNSAEQASTDSGGQFAKVGDGQYRYTFGTKLPQGFDQTATHTVAAWASRNLSEFELGTDLASDTFDWVPNGSAVTVRRNVVRDQQCNQCHGRLVLHGSRTGVALCIVCHTPQSTDPDTGNTVDMATMIHKIHRGEDLPSVQAGTPYQIIGFRQSVHDYSTVAYPADVRNCQTCHIENPETIAALQRSALQASSASGFPSRSSGRSRSRSLLSADDAPPVYQQLDANHHLLRPSRRACGSCHDQVNFMTGENHASLPQISDNQCTRCHTPQGELEYDLSIKGAHTIERFSNELPGTNFEIFSVTDTAPGQTPTVTFGITNDAGQPVPPSSMGRLALVLAGEIDTAADFSGIVSENATSATGQAGRYTYTFNMPLPETARGSWAVGIEGYQNATILAGTLQERQVRDAGENKVLFFSVGGGMPATRRAVVAQEKCDSCHFDLDLHGSNRNAVEHCVLCHNPNATDVARRPEDQAPPESVNFKLMIHRIHLGEENTRDYTIYGFGGTPHNYNELRFPRDRADCAACHMEGTEQLPLQENLLSAVDPRGFFNPSPPVTGACVSCHANVPAAAHADLNISPTFGESCAVCHGQGSQFAVDKVHAE